MTLEAWSQFATVAVTLFVGVQVWREVRRGRDLIRATDARVNAIAYALLRQLRSWLGTGPGKTPSLATWYEKAKKNGGTFKEELDTAEERAMEMAALAPEGSPVIAEAARSALVLFMSGADHLTRHAATEQPEDIFEISNWSDLLKNAANELDGCRVVIERQLVAPAILEAERSLKAKREYRNPSMQSLVHKAFDEMRREEAVRRRLDPGSTEEKGAEETEGG